LIEHANSDHEQIRDGHNVPQYPRRVPLLARPAVWSMTLPGVPNISIAANVQKPGFQKKPGFEFPENISF
jgi:hypothetical protein